MIYLKFIDSSTRCIHILAVEETLKYEQLLSFIARVFDSPLPSKLVYVDSDNDYISVTSDEDVVAMFHFARENCLAKPLTIFLQTTGSALKPTPQSVRKAVADTYTQLASTQGGCCCTTKKYAISLGYSEEDIALESGAIGSLSCGNPAGIADLKEGESVMDLGCGAGFDCRIAARRVGQTGKVVGVDMTPAMLEQAKSHTPIGKYPHVIYYQSKIEDLKSISEFQGTFDAVISNCVFNLSPEKQKVLDGVFSVLKPGGRLIFSDPVALRPIPPHVRKDMRSLTQCMANASSVEELSQMLSAAGFERISINVSNQEKSESYVAKWTPGSKWEDGMTPAEYIATAAIFAYKPSQ